MRGSSAQAKAFFREPGAGASPVKAARGRRPQGRRGETAVAAPVPPPLPGVQVAFLPARFWAAGQFGWYRGDFTPSHETSLTGRLLFCPAAFRRRKPWPKNLPNSTTPKGTEDRIYQTWCDKGYFHTKIDRSKRPFTIVMPPPNVTGQLHMGHAMGRGTWQDIPDPLQAHAGLCRFVGARHRPRFPLPPRPRSWRRCRKRGLTKEMLGREGFLERAWAWKNTYGNRIVGQLKKLGCSCDWQRERFHDGRGLFRSRAGRGSPVLYEKGLDLPRQPHGSTWCPHCNTSISDAEVEYEEKSRAFLGTCCTRSRRTGEMLEAGDDPPRDDARRYGGRHQHGRCALCPPARLPCGCCRC